MEDQDIIRLYWDRDSAALTATAEKYGTYCGIIARNILGSEEDAEECVNDAYLSAWNAIPPQTPRRLAPFLGRIVRNLALDRYRHDRVEKRWTGEFPTVLDELAEVLPGSETPEGEVSKNELVHAINNFLGELPRRKRELFVRRYWYSEPIHSIASAVGMTAGGVTMALKRLREALKRDLIKRGFEV